MTSIVEIPVWIISSGYVRSLGLMELPACAVESIYQFDLSQNILLEILPHFINSLSVSLVHIFEELTEQYIELGTNATIYPMRCFPTSKLY